MPIDELTALMTTSISIDFSDPAIQADPWPVYQELRQRNPGPNWAPGFSSRHLASLPVAFGSS